MYYVAVDMWITRPLTTTNTSLKPSGDILRPKLLDKVSVLIIGLNGLYEAANRFNG